MAFGRNVDDEDENEEDEDDEDEDPNDEDDYRTGQFAIIIIFGPFGEDTISR